MAIQLFTLTVDGNLEINKLELLTHIPFRNIIRRDRGSRGDSQGRYKERAFRELAYIYHYADIRSTIVTKAYSDEKRHKESVKAAGLDLDWKPDEEVLQAIKVYQAEQEVESAEMIRDILSTFQANGQVVKRANRTIKKILDKGELSKDELVELLNMNTLVFNFSKEIPTLTKELSELLNRFNLDTDGEVHILRGVKEVVPDSFDPERAKG